MRRQRNRISRQSQLIFQLLLFQRELFVQPMYVVAGNIESKGYPTWAISKGVARENQKRNSRKDWYRKNILT